MRHLPALLACAALTACTAVAAPAFAQSLYRPGPTIALGAPDRWDYVVADAAARRVYVAHGDRVAVIDLRTDRLAGEVTGIGGGTHGVAIAGGHGFTDDGKNGQVVAFDLKTFKVLRTIPADADADALIAEPATGHIFAISGDPGTITVVDARSLAKVATIQGGEKMEYAAADGKGLVYVAGEAKRDLLKIDARTNRVVARWATPDCESPHGLAYDAAGKRLFMGCVNSLMMVVDATDGRIVASLPIGPGSDAIVYDAAHHRVLSSNGRDGTISIYQQASPDHYTALAPVKTMVSGRTMTLDPVSGRLFVAAADTTPPPTPDARPGIVANSLRLLSFAPTH